LAILNTQLQQLHQYALAPNTFRLYNTALSSYNNFCYQVNLLPFPISEYLLELYVTAVSNRLAYATIKLYLSGIQYHSRMNGSTVNISSMSRLYYALRGVRRIQGAHRTLPQRLPITISHLHCIYRYLDDSSYCTEDKLMLKSVVSLAFYALLRCSEYTSSSAVSFDVTSNLLFRDIRFNNPITIAYITLKGSKTDPFRTGCVIRVAATQSRICPVSALHEYMSIHPAINGPLFMFYDGRYFTRNDLVTLLRRSLPFVHNINTHSFRIGGASAAAAAGLPDSTIQILGRWSSDAYRRYLRLPDSVVSNANIKMSQTNLSAHVWNF